MSTNSRSTMNTYLRELTDQANDITTTVGGIADTIIHDFGLKTSLNTKTTSMIKNLLRGVMRIKRCSRDRIEPFVGSLHPKIHVEGDYRSTSFHLNIQSFAKGDVLLDKDKKSQVSNFVDYDVFFKVQFKNDEYTITICTLNRNMNLHVHEAKLTRESLVKLMLNMETFL